MRSVKGRSNVCYSFDFDKEDTTEDDFEMNELTESMSSVLSQLAKRLERTRAGSEDRESGSSRVEIEEDEDEDDAWSMLRKEEERRKMVKRFKSFSA